MAEKTVVPAQLLFEPGLDTVTFRTDSGVEIVGDFGSSVTSVLDSFCPLVDRFSAWSAANFHGDLLRPEYELVRAFLLWLAKGAPSAPESS